MKESLESELREGKVKETLALYYENFSTEKSLTISEAAAKLGIKGIEIHHYITSKTGEGLGMPENREEAIKYKDILKTL